MAIAVALGDIEALRELQRRNEQRRNERHRLMDRQQPGQGEQ
jgi:predicted secreted protein